jgi:hypothetical protein
MLTEPATVVQQSSLSGDATHLMFVDADIQFNPTDIVKLVGHMTKIL